MVVPTNRHRAGCWHATCVSKNTRLLVAPTISLGPAVGTPPALNGRLMVAPTDFHRAGCWDTTCVQQTHAVVGAIGDLPWTGRRRGYWVGAVVSACHPPRRGAPRACLEAALRTWRSVVSQRTFIRRFQKNPACRHGVTTDSGFTIRYTPMSAPHDFPGQA